MSTTVTSDTYYVPRVELGLVEMGGRRSWVRGAGEIREDLTEEVGWLTFRSLGRTKTAGMWGGVGCANGCEVRRRCRARARVTCFIYLQCLKAGKEDSRTGLPTL